MTSRYQISIIEDRLHEIETYVNLAKKYIAECRAKHQKINLDNGTYDKIQYYTMQIAIQNDISRTCLNKTRSREPLKLANGSKLNF